MCYSMSHCLECVDHFLEVMSKVTEGIKHSEYISVWGLLYQSFAYNFHNANICSEWQLMLSFSLFV